MLGAARDERGVVSFKGIPYAAPPVGELRWRGPQAAEPWEGVRDATQFGARCYSAWVEDQSPGPPRSEDCLTLNVWTPAQAPGEKRPVMVWVHGGGFQFGSSAERMSDGALLAAGGVVVVSFNYRVGVFGFLAHPELDAEGPSGTLRAAGSTRRAALGAETTSRRSAGIRPTLPCSANRRARTPSGF